MTTAHFQSSLVGSRCYLGKKAARLHAVKFKLSDYLDMNMIFPPRVFGHVANRDDLVMGVLANDICGCCVVAGGMHEVMIWTRAAWHHAAPFGSMQAKQQYIAASGWNGIANDPSDTGLDMAQFASHRRNAGLIDASGAVHKIKAFTQINSWDNLIKAAYVFGAAALGVRFPGSAMDQFDKQQPWSPIKGASIEGGHYVPIVGRNSRGNLVCVTWGRLQAITREFYEAYGDEALAYIPGPDYLDSVTHLTPEKFDEAKLDSDLARLATS